MYDMMETKPSTYYVLYLDKNSESGLSWNLTKNHKPENAIEFYYSTDKNFINHLLTKLTKLKSNSNINPMPRVLTQMLCDQFNYNDCQNLNLNYDEKNLKNFLTTNIKNLTS